MAFARLCKINVTWRHSRRVISVVRRGYGGLADSLLWRGRESAIFSADHCIRRACPALAAAGKQRVSEQHIHECRRAVDPFCGRLRPAGDELRGNTRVVSPESVVESQQLSFAALRPGAGSVTTQSDPVTKSVPEIAASMSFGNAGGRPVSRAMERAGSTLAVGRRAEIELSIHQPPTNIKIL
jgi:hypothetical protein